MIVVSSKNQIDTLDYSDLECKSGYLVLVRFYLCVLTCIGKWPHASSFSL
jgi:hypothetical protein